MSMVPVYVRCRDAAFYRDPILVISEGFVCFDDVEPPELVLWIPQGRSEPELSPAAAMQRIFGNYGFGRLAQKHKLSERAVPGVEPLVFAPAQSYLIEITRRIPRPQIHEGAVRRTSRVGECHVIDFPPAPPDAYELEVRGSS
jgi:hypothetical protein